MKNNDACLYYATATLSYSPLPFPVFTHLPNYRIRGLKDFLLPPVRVIIFFFCSVCWGCSSRLVCVCVGGALQRDGRKEREGDWRAAHLDPDGQGVGADLLGGVAGGAGHLARHRHWDGLGALVARGGDGEAGDGLGRWVDGVLHLWVAGIARLAIGEGGSELWTRR